MNRPRQMFAEHPSACRWSQDPPPAIAEIERWMPPTLRQPGCRTHRKLSAHGQVQNLMRRPGGRPCWRSAPRGSKTLRVKMPLPPRGRALQRCSACVFCRRFSVAPGETCGSRFVSCLRRRLPSRNVDVKAIKRLFYECLASETGLPCRGRRSETGEALMDRRIAVRAPAGRA